MNNSNKIIQSLAKEIVNRKMSVPAIFFLESTKYISFIDSDDGWEQDKLEKQISFMEKNDLAFTYTDYTSFYESQGKRDMQKKTNLKESFDFKAFVKNSSINTTTMIIKRSILKNHKFKKIKPLRFIS